VCGSLSTSPPNLVYFHTLGNNSRMPDFEMCQTQSTNEVREISINVYGWKMCVYKFICSELWKLWAFTLQRQFILTSGWQETLERECVSVKDVKVHICTNESRALF